MKPYMSQHEYLKFWKTKPRNTVRVWVHFVCVNCTFGSRYIITFSPGHRVHHEKVSICFLSFGSSVNYGVFFFCFQLKPCLFLLFWFFFCFHRVILLSSISYLLTQISQVFCFFLSLDYDFCHILQHKLSIGDAPRREAFFHCKHLGKDIMIRLKGQNSPSLYFIIYLLLPEWVEYLGKLQSLCRLGPFHSNSPISFYYLLLSYWPVVRHLIFNHHVQTEK